MSNTVLYEVTIKRRPPASGEPFFIKHQYRWEVEIWLNGEKSYEFGETGYTYRLKKAKKQALKHVLNSDKRLGSGQKFGVLINVSGTAAEVKERLGDS